MTPEEATLFRVAEYVLETWNDVDKITADVEKYRKCERMAYDGGLIEWQPDCDFPAGYPKPTSKYVKLMDEIYPELW